MCVIFLKNIPLLENRHTIEAYLQAHVLEGQGSRVNVFLGPWSEKPDYTDLNMFVSKYEDDGVSILVKVSQKILLK